MTGFIQTIVGWEEMRTRAETWPVIAAGACGSVCAAILVLRDIPGTAWLPEADPTPIALQLLAATLAGAMLASVLFRAATLYFRRKRPQPLAAPTLRVVRLPYTSD